MSARSVVVVMPFGGKGQIERRQAILNFKRLEYLVRNKCNVIPARPASDNDRVVYAVEVAKTAMDNIPEKALQQIEAADILIALVVEPNPNVIYEVAFRRTGDLPIVLVVDSPDNLPLYVQSLGRQNWKQDDILARINMIANDKVRKLPDFTVGIPDDLKEVIDYYDDQLQKGLEDALQEIERQFKPHPIEAVEHLRGIVSDKTSSFYPCSIVEVEFSGRSEFANPKHPSIVTDLDNRFSCLYGYVDKKSAEADYPLTLDKLLNRIEKFSDKCHWNEFIEEQVQLADIIVRNYGFARATVPLRINQNHTDEVYRGKCYLPCVVAQVIDGSLDERHTMYLLVVYIEIPDILKLDKSTT